MNIYLASSWRNPKYESTREFLQGLGHTVYDFKNTESAFDWKDIDPAFEMHGDKKTTGLSASKFREALRHPLARKGYDADLCAVLAADCLILLLPCGRSAHTEFGIATGVNVAPGRKKFTIVFLDDPISEPELMYMGATMLVTNVEELKSAVEVVDILVSSMKEAQDERREGPAADRGGRRETSG